MVAQRTSSQAAGEIYASLHGWAGGADMLMPVTPAQARTRYEENVLPGNHTSVFGSWWQDGQWGFACCHQTTKNSYCTGEAGLRADARAEQRLADNLEARARQLESSQATTSAPAAKVCVALAHCVGVALCLDEAVGVALLVMGAGGRAEGTMWALDRGERLGARNPGQPADVEQ